ncbi:hypothetical protein N781_05255 [Pontibacillus halophilus JSM 076056 = DSM 19796]|uniref:Amidase n=1 Tax=Pontibacillus halophilus JSM 076056 = DSM 19796 TaxID=1385510 RepID=A0A0A5GIY8_9BACI|nr:hypothetical protein [Pontibacillus halophilus]KGX91105.1 hypothetical protein N781_05255 [Pontibacillus halophilus JSM 076056 = DSM 19796]
MNRKRLGKGLVLLALFVSLGVWMTVGGNQDRVKATWIWDTSSVEESPQEVVEFAKQEGINRIYVHVSTKDFRPEQYRDFIEEAGKRDIEVFALGGDPNWALSKHKRTVQGFASIVQTYNENVPEEAQFQGIHVDIEPYLLPKWEGNQEQVVKDWMGNVEALVQQVKEDDSLMVSGDFPFWIHKITVPNGDETLSNWMLGQLDSMTVMAYRDQATGPNSIKSIVTPLMEEASDNNHSLVVAVNIINTSEGDHTTFYGKGSEALTSELTKLNKELRKEAGYAGIAIHDYKNWKQEIQ